MLNHAKEDELIATNLASGLGKAPMPACSLALW
jgi:hypothetical protein